MNISGVLVHAYPQKIAEVSRHLARLQGVEVHATTQAGKIVVTIEQSNENDLSTSLMQLQDVPGVLNAAMVYHRFDAA